MKEEWARKVKHFPLCHKGFQTALLEKPFYCKAFSDAGSR
jgi:hypothetical protein